jgi:uncharacterized protein (TIGR00299 family) protein
VKALYLDIFSGISGDMFLGALLDLGVDLKTLEKELSKLGVDEFHLHAAKGQKCGIEGTKFDVHLTHAHDHEHDHGDHQHDHGHHHHHHGHSHSHSHADPLAHLLNPIQQPKEEEHEHVHGQTFAEIKQLILKAPYSAWVKEKAIGVFERIARAEGKVHGKPPESVHFHEVGAIDSIVDIVGGCIALEILGKPTVYAAPVVEGMGFVKCAHGRFPIPAPATLAILAERGVTISQCAEQGELVTPTGAALLAEFAESFATLQNFRPEKIAYGLGTRDNVTRPNVLRVLSGETAAPASNLDWERDEIAVLETNLDDMPSEFFGHFMELAFSRGALDVFYVPLQMKKNRPGILLTVLCNVQSEDELTELMLRQTTAFGVRRTRADRRKLPRKVVTVKTSFGPVQVKLGLLKGQTVQAAPEFESCKSLAAQTGQSLSDIYNAARQAAFSGYGNSGTA